MPATATEWKCCAHCTDTGYVRDNKVGDCRLCGGCGKFEGNLCFLCGGEGFEKTVAWACCPACNSLATN